ncbi:hypothetical protein [Actinoplanes sichuanensis]|uniref:Uncharacterized protein n=1 Tax=Actinoplanes sichuanensis TaxID=512349 RepID=A0ABW4ASM7_9ACTN|nr:hypothetical protein [Actinoplanes sichuanensis]
MNFPLDELGSAVSARAETWERLGLEWRIGPVAPNHGKPVVVGEFESAVWLGGLLIWISGEAELDAVRVCDDHAVSKHYDLAGRADLEVLFGELDALLTAGRVPDAAVVHRHPSPPAS